MKSSSAVAGIAVGEDRSRTQIVALAADDIQVEEIGGHPPPVIVHGLCRRRGLGDGQHHNKLDKAAHSPAAPRLRGSAADADAPRWRAAEPSPSHKGPAGEQTNQELPTSAAALHFAGKCSRAATEPPRASQGP